VRDYAEVDGSGRIDVAITQHALLRLGVDEVGLDSIDNRYLDLLVRTFEGGPVGIDTLAAAVGEQADTLEDVCEPFLMQVGYLKRSPRGRVATAAAWRHLGLTPARAAGGQEELPVK
jgi:Holliday junction DNA helicase RuvB